MLLKELGLNPATVPDRKDRSHWPQIGTIIAQAFKTRTRSEWRSVFDHSDACVTPVLSFAEARADAHAVARDSFVEVGGVVQPAPAPRFSGSAAHTPTQPPMRGEGGLQALRDWGLSMESIASLRSHGVSLLDE